MSLPLVALIGVLFGTGTYLLLHRTITQIILGVALMGNGANLLLLTSGGRAGNAPILGEDGPFTDPVPQALVLTSIVIGLGLQAFLLALAWRNWTLDGNDEVEDDISDRRMGRSAAPDHSAPVGDGDGDGPEEAP